MRKIAEHQTEEQEEVMHKDNLSAQPQVQILTMEQLTNFKLDDINTKLDYILSWIQTQLPKELPALPK